MRRNPDVSFTHLGMVAGLVLLVGLMGCRNRPPLQATSESKIEYPAYVYPAQPPVVDRQKLESLMARLDSNLTVLWLMGHELNKAPSVANKLARNRNAIRTNGGRIIGLYPGHAGNWRATVVPMLKTASANFPCAVLAPPARSSIAGWLAGNPRSLRPGIYLVDRRQQVIGAYPADEIGINQLLAKLKNVRDLAVFRQQESLYARVRLIRLYDGRVLAHATAEADKPGRLAEVLAEQLTDAISDPGRTALLRFRGTGNYPSEMKAVWETLSPDLTELLQANGWSTVVRGDRVEQVLARWKMTPMSVEFTPTRLAGRVSWQAVLVGSFGVRKGDGAG